MKTVIPDKVNAIGRVCRVIGVRTNAEMVESDEVRQMLASLEVDYAQGFGMARPHPESAGIAEGLT